MSVTAEPISTQAPPEPAIPDVPIYRLTVEQYHAMARAGILTEDDPVELLEGWLVQKMTKRPPHMVATGLLLDLLPPLLPAGWHLIMQDPVECPDSVPEPDAAVVRGARRDYRERRPTAADVALVVEVADSSLEQDRGAKKRIYARAGIPVYWIVNLVDQQIEVYTDPSGPVAAPDFGQQQIYGLADTAAVVLAGAAVGSLPVRDLLP